MLPSEHRIKFTQLFIDKKTKVEQQPFIVCCEELVIVESSWQRKFIIYIMLLNRVYIAFSVPFYIGFNISIQRGILISEIVSHTISLFVFLIEFRTPVVKDSGEMTLELKYVYRNYLKRGFILDILAFQPINLILPFLINYNFIETSYA